MKNVSVPGRGPRRKTRGFTRRQLSAARRLLEREAKQLAKAQRFEERRQARSSRKVEAAMKGCGDGRNDTEE